MVVVDTDCLVAGTLTPTGATSVLLDLWQEGAFELVVCPQLLDEVRKTLLHPRVGPKYGIVPGDVEAFVARLQEEGLVHDDPVDPPRVVPDDPKDDYLVALARAAGANCLVTRDRHFEKVRVQDLRIVGPAAFVRELGDHRT